MRALTVLGAGVVAAASAIGTSGAQTLTVQEVFEKYGQIGTWAWDCSKPPSAGNLYYVNRAIDAGHIQRDEMVGPSERQHVSVIDKAISLGPTEISVSGKRDNQAGEAIWRVEPNRQIAWEVSSEGKKVISAGKLLANGQPIRWTNKCATGPGRQGQVPSSTAGPALAAAPTPTLSGAEIVWYGVYSAEASTMTVNANDVGGKSFRSSNVTPPSANSEKIQIADNMRFGFGFRLIGSPEGAKVSVKVIRTIPSPGIRNGVTGQYDLSGETDSEVMIGSKAQTGFVISKAANIPTGNWTFALWHDNRRLAEKTFVLSR